MNIEWIAGIVILSLVGVALSAEAQEPTSDNDYGRPRLGGTQGGIEWEPLLPGAGLEGWRIEDDPWTATAWTREGDTIQADVGDGYRARIVAGDETWRFFELKVGMTMVTGGSPQIWFNIHDDQDHHFAPLLGWQTAAIMAPDHTKLDVVNHVFERNQEYDIVLAVRGKSVTTYIDGRLVNRLTLDKAPKGGIGLAVWGRHTVARFRSPKIRHYHREKPH